MKQATEDPIIKSILEASRKRQSDTAGENQQQPKADWLPPNFVPKVFCKKFKNLFLRDLDYSLIISCFCAIYIYIYICWLLVCALFAIVFCSAKSSGGFLGNIKLQFNLQQTCFNEH